MCKFYLAYQQELGQDFKHDQADPGYDTLEAAIDAGTDVLLQSDGVAPRAFEVRATIRMFERVTRIASIIPAEDFWSQLSAAPQPPA